MISLDNVPSRVSGQRAAASLRSLRSSAETHTADPAGQAVEVVHDTDNRFYQLLVDGESAGLVVYGTDGDRYVFTHTFIAEGYRRTGSVPGPAPGSAGRHQSAAGHGDELLPGP